jgi:predicted dithiol-disulfide oxidoreductase (DUF899 family)
VLRAARPCPNRKGDLIMPSKSSTAPKRKAAPTVLHAERFPGESKKYRTARNELLKAEMELRRQIEDVAATRRRLPLGGAAPEDYVFEEGAADLADTTGTKRVKMSELFVRPDASLVIYSFMYGPNMTKACPSCTSIIDALNGTAVHVTQRINLGIVASSPIARIREFARERGWNRLRLLSSAGNTYNHDYHAQTAAGSQIPALNVFVRRGGRVYHTFGAELLYAPPELGQNGRQCDMIWPLWNLFDYTAEGRGTDWHPKLSYPA